MLVMTMERREMRRRRRRRKRLESWRKWKKEKKERLLNGLRWTVPGYTGQRLTAVQLICLSMRQRPSTGRFESIQGNQHPLLHTLRSVEADDHIEAFDVDSCDMACQRLGQKVLFPLLFLPGAMGVLRSKITKSVSMQ
ncbi:hypothetical protein NXS19_004982 [Fusarium pseudograminearum]|nr:hypothetical protein NXS19_004982 [Fusarium pseudograminearum]